MLHLCYICNDKAGSDFLGLCFSDKYVTEPVLLSIVWNSSPATEKHPHLVDCRVLHGLSPNFSVMQGREGRTRAEFFPKAPVCSGLGEAQEEEAVSCILVLDTQIMAKALRSPAEERAVELWWLRITQAYLTREHHSHSHFVYVIVCLPVCVCVCSKDSLIFLRT